MTHLRGQEENPNVDGFTTHHFCIKKKIKRVKLEKEKKKLDKRQAGEACGSLQGTLQSPRLMPAEGARHGALDHPRPRCTGMLFLT